MAVHDRIRAPALYGICVGSRGVRRMQTSKHAANVGSRLKLAWKPGRRHLKSQPSSRIGENPPYGMIGGIEETSASFEARSAPRSYPTEPHRPRVMRQYPWGYWRSVDRG